MGRVLDTNISRGGIRLKHGIVSLIASNQGPAVYIIQKMPPIDVKLGEKGSDDTCYYSAAVEFLLIAPEHKYSKLETGLDW